MNLTTNPLQTASLSTEIDETYILPEDEELIKDYADKNNTIDSLLVKYDLTRNELIAIIDSYGIPHVIRTEKHIEDHQKIEALCATGKTSSEIKAETGISEHVVARIVHRYKKKNCLLKPKVPKNEIPLEMRLHIKQDYLNGMTIPQIRKKYNLPVEGRLLF